jgi:iron complex transport system substrate-binding protein
MPSPPRRPVAALAALALLILGACADDDEAASATTTTAVTTAAPSSSTGPITSTPTSAIAGGTRTVEGADGPIEIPADPQRIVGDLISLDYMSALGMDTAAFIGVFGAEFFDDDHYLADVLQRPDLVDPGFAFEANLESLAAAKPDLIVAPFDQIDGAPGLDAMRQIAPVLIVPTSGTRDPGVRYGGAASFQDWRTTLRNYGAVLDRSDEAEAYIAETEADLAALRADHGPLIDATTATQMKSTTDFVAINALSSALESGVLGTILLSELGFQPPPAQAAATIDEYGTIELSPENLGLVDGDLLFVEVREGVREFESNPLWPTLQVVKDRGVIEVGNHWEYGGAVAARVVLDDVRAALDDLAARS